MDPDETFGSGGRRAPDGLRDALRAWTVPGPPPEIEQELRRVFRDRRSRNRRWRTWAAAGLAASAAVLMARRGHELPALRPAQTAVAPPLEADRPPITVRDEAPAPERSTAPSRVPIPPRRSAVRRSAGSEVIVEPGQAELLLRFARQLRETAPVDAGFREGIAEVDAAALEVRTMELPPLAPVWVPPSRLGTARIVPIEPSRTENDAVKPLGGDV